VCFTALGDVLTPNRSNNVFVGGQEGASGTSNYRIPALVVAPDGTLLAFIEARRSGADPGAAGFPIDLAVKRSTDGGNTWGEYTVLASDTLADSTPTVAFDYSDPRSVVDRETGTVAILYGQWPDDCGQGCVPAGLGTDTSVAFMRTSTDNGLTWTPAVDLNSQVKDPSWAAFNTGPGIGIQLRYQDAAPERNGRLVIPSQRRLAGAIAPLPIYSDDGGASWTAANLPQNPQPGNESEVVELINGDLLLDVRPDSGSQRDRYLSTDGGANWVFTGLGDFTITTVDTGIVRFSARRDGNDRDRILYSGPAGSPVGAGNNRSNLVIWTSYDEGQSFINPIQAANGFSAYSVINILNDKSIGVIYEATNSTLVRYLNYSISQIEGASHDPELTHFDGFGNAVDTLRGGIGWSGKWSTSGVVNQRQIGLEFAGMATTNDMHRLQLTGGQMTRSLGIAPIDLGVDGVHYFSLFIRADADGADLGSQEFLDIDFISGGNTPIAFGVGSNENFAVNLAESGAVSSASDAMAMETTYFLLAKVEAKSSGDDSLQLAWYDNVDDVPDQETAITWGLEKTGSLSGIIDSIRIEGGANATWNVDALRIGSTFHSVVFTDGVAPEVPGDLNADGQITLLDWLALKFYYGLDTSSMTIPDRQDHGDFDSNGIVDIGDFLRFREMYDASYGAGALTSISEAVPESSSIALAAIVLSSTGRKFRQRTILTVYDSTPCLFLAVKQSEPCSGTI